MDERGCTDELLSAIPYHGCQLKWEPHEPWGVPTQELAKSFKPSVFTSGYIKRELLMPTFPLHITRACTLTLEVNHCREHRQHWW